MSGDWYSVSEGSTYLTKDRSLDNVIYLAKVRRTKSQHSNGLERRYKIRVLWIMRSISLFVLAYSVGLLEWEKVVKLRGSDRTSEDLAKPHQSSDCWLMYMVLGCGLIGLRLCCTGSFVRKVRLCVAVLNSGRALNSELRRSWWAVRLGIERCCLTSGMEPETESVVVVELLLALLKVADGGMKAATGNRHDIWRTLRAGHTVVYVLGAKSRYFCDRSLRLTGLWLLECGWGSG